MSAGHYTQVQMRELRDGRVVTIDGMTGVWRISERYATMEADYVEAKSREHRHAFASIEGN